MAQRLLTSPNQTHEAELWSRGFGLVAGVDEVGRGAWAGPVVAAAVILPREVSLPQVRDSKLLTRLQRQRLAVEIKKSALMIGVGWSSSVEIDEVGLSRALSQAGERALSNLNADAVLLDGSFNYLVKRHVETIVRADQCCLNVAAASIIAKVARDNYMARVHQRYPEFGFDKNVGYGTKHHIQQISHGLTPLHRRSFKPVKLASANVG